MYGASYLRYLCTRSNTNIHESLDNLSSLDTLLSALDNLDKLFETVEDAFKTSMENDDIERWEEKS
jgi:hypothetical protein